MLKYEGTLTAQKPQTRQLHVLKGEQSVIFRER